MSTAFSPLPFAGTSIAVLRDEDGERTVLVRMEAGARFPEHRHPGGEQLFVVEGDAAVGDRALSAGDFLYTAPGDSHAVTSRAGCLLFITVPRPIEITG